MKLLLRPAFLVCLAIFSANQVLESNKVFIPFIHSYADDVCALPVLLTLASAGMALVYYGRGSLERTYRLSFLQVLFALVYCSVVFEVVLPAYAARYIADKWDIAAYTVGAGIFYLFINPAKAQQIS